MKKKIILFALAVVAAAFTVSWNGLNAFFGTRTQLHSEFRGKTNVLQISPLGNYDPYVLTFDLSRYAGQRVVIEVSMQMWLNTPTQVIWQLNTGGHPLMAGDWNTRFTANQWHTIQDTNTVPIEADTILYLSTMQFGNTTAYVADFEIKINGEVVSNDIIIDNSLPALHTKWPFRVGTAIIDYFSPIFVNYTDPASPHHTLLRHFNVMVAETQMKPAYIMPEPWTPNGAYRWTKADRFLEYSQANNISMRGHVLFWHQSTPKEFFQGSGREGRATINELYTRMEHHARTVFQKCGGSIEWWDVVNEVVGENGPRRGGGLESVVPETQFSLYTRIMEDAGKTSMDRYEFVLNAFRWARQYADANGGQNVKLFLTEYNIESPGAMQTEFLRLLDWLIANNAPIDGVGIQGHINLNSPSVREFSRVIDTIAAKRNPVTGRNLVVQVCELDIALFRPNEGNRTTLSDRELNTRLTQQARRYRELFNMFEQKYNEGKLDMVVLWGIADGQSAANFVTVSDRVEHPLLFDRNFQPKPAFHELIRGR